MVGDDQRATLVREDVFVYYFTAMFRFVSSDEFPPFGNFLIHFPEVENKAADLAEVHLITGINGTGKTRILSLLAAALGNYEPLKRRFQASKPHVFRFAENIHALRNINGPHTGWATVHGNNFGFQLNNQFSNWARAVPAFAYSGVAYVGDSKITAMADVPAPDRASCLTFNRLEAQSVGLIQAIANLKIQAAMESMDDNGSPEVPTNAVLMVRRLERVISEITDLPFNFTVTSHPSAVISVRWAKHILPFNGLPDGLRSLIGWLAHAVVMMNTLLGGQKNPLESEAIFLFDEIETSLHPAWQRKVLPAFQKLFPKAQIFVATHSPFVIASLNHGWIHRLRMKQDGTVAIEEPRAASEGDSYVEVVEDILGVPEWYDTETEGLLSEFRTLRDAAYTGDAEPRAKAYELAERIGQRSTELQLMMGKEVHQMSRQLEKMQAAQA